MWTGDRGRATAELFNRFVPSLTQLPVYLCGPKEMMDATTELLITLGAPSTKIHTEAFAGKKSSVSNSEGETASASDSSPTISRATPPTITMPPAKGGTATIRFSRSGSSTQVDADTTIPEAAGSVSIEIPYECRSGISGQSKTRLLDGIVQMDCEDALSVIEKANGIIPACQARPQSHVEVDV
jgi:hypothetical protein